MLERNVLVILLACQPNPPAAALDPVAQVDDRVELTTATMAFDTVQLIGCGGESVRLPQERPADLLSPRLIAIEAGEWCGLELEFSSGAGVSIAGVTMTGTPFRYSLAPRSMRIDEAFSAEGTMTLSIELGQVIPVTALDEAALRSPDDPLDFGVQSPESIDMVQLLAQSFVIQAG